MKEKALRRLAEKLNAAGVTWAMGAGWLLCRLGVTEDYHDLDLFVAEADAARADAALAGLGMASAPDTSDGFRRSYHFDGADIDLTSGMTVRREDGIYRIPFGPEDVAGAAQVLGAQVPLMYPEDWLVIYGLIGRESRVRALEAWLRARGPEHPERFRRVCPGPLPDSLEQVISSLIGGK